MRSYLEIPGLFSSSDGGAKTLLKISTAPIPDKEPSTPKEPISNLVQPDQEFCKFIFTASTNRNEDIEVFRHQISQIISHIEKKKGQQESIRQSVFHQGNCHVEKEEDMNLNTEKVKPNADPLNIQSKDTTLLQGDSNSKGDQSLTEVELWDERNELLYHEAGLGSASSSEDVKINIGFTVTPRIINDIFEKFPAVQKMYNENVPPLSDQAFWTRYYRSKLFNQSLSPVGQTGDRQHDDNVEMSIPGPSEIQTAINIPKEKDADPMVVDEVAQDPGGAPEDAEVESNNESSEADDNYQSIRTSPTSEPDAFVAENEEDDTEEILEYFDYGEYIVREWRYRLQRFFLGKIPLTETMMPKVASVVNNIEDFEMQSDWLRSTKLAKVIKRIGMLEDSEVPLDAQYNIRVRCRALLDRWQQTLGFPESFNNPVIMAEAIQENEADVAQMSQSAGPLHVNNAQDDDSHIVEDDEFLDGPAAFVAAFKEAEQRIKDEMVDPESVVKAWRRQLQRVFLGSTPPTRRMVSEMARTLRDIVAFEMKPEWLRSSKLVKVLKRIAVLEYPTIRWEYKFKIRERCLALREKWHQNLGYVESSSKSAKVIEGSQENKPDATQDAESAGPSSRR